MADIGRGGRGSYGNALLAVTGAGDDSLPDPQVLFGQFLGPDGQEKDVRAGRFEALKGHSEDLLQALDFSVYPKPSEEEVIAFCGQHIDNFVNYLNDVGAQNGLTVFKDFLNLVTILASINLTENYVQPKDLKGFLMTIASYLQQSQQIAPEILQAIVDANIRMVVAPGVVDDPGAELSLVALIRSVLSLMSSDRNVYLFDGDCSNSRSFNTGVFLNQLGPVCSPTPLFGEAAQLQADAAAEADTGGKALAVAYRRNSFT